MTKLKKKPSKAKQRAARVVQDRRELREKNKRQKEREVARRPVPNGNARMIRDMMVQDKVKGSWKDYVIITGNRLLNGNGRSFEIKLEEGATTGVDAVALVHKRKLVNVIGPDEAARFWHPQLGRVVEVPEQTKPSKKE